MVALTGMPSAQFIFGAELHAFGLGGMARPWYEKAAYQGYPGAIYALAWYSLTGERNFPKNEHEAWKWFYLGGLKVEGMAVDVSLLGYHRVLFEPGFLLDLARNKPPRIVDDELAYIDSLSRDGLLPFVLDEAGYRETLKR